MFKDLKNNMNIMRKENIKKYIIILYKIIHNIQIIYNNT